MTLPRTRNVSLNQEKKIPTQKRVSLTSIIVASQHSTRGAISAITSSHSTPNLFSVLPDHLREMAGAFGKLCSSIIVINSLIIPCLDSCNSSRVSRSQVLAVRTTRVLEYAWTAHSLGKGSSGVIPNERRRTVDGSVIVVGSEDL